MPSDFDILKERHKKWLSKKVLQKLYHKWYSMIGESMNRGKTLELGGGSGNLKEFFPDVLSSDIVLTPWLDAVLDAHELPFKPESMDNIVLFDVLHHLARPELFFFEVQRVLKEKGKLIIIEPYISWTSFLVYRFLHQEGMLWHIHPFNETCFNKTKNAFQGNQAIPTLIFKKYREQFKKKFHQLEIMREEKMDFFLYPLSGGFHHPTLFPEKLYPVLDFLEKLFEPLNGLLAFRMLLVLEKTD